MASRLGDFVRAPGYLPSLRSDIKFYKEEATDIVVVHDQIRDRKLQLQETECLIAREMNGARDLDELTRAAKQHVPWATREQIESLAIQIAGMGLLANVPPELLGWAPQPAPDPHLPPAHAPAAELPDDSSDGREDLADLLAPPPVGAPGEVETSRQAGAPGEVETSREAEASREGGTSGEAAEPAPPGKAWEIERPSWFTRHRKLVYAGGLAAVLVLLALIPYPLYITDACDVLPAERARVRSRVDGLIVEVLVREGELVKAGQPLMRLDTRDPDYALSQATAEVDRMSAALVKVRAGNRPEEIRKAKTLVETRAQDLKFASVEAARQEQMLAQGVASAAQRDGAARDMEIKRAALGEAEAELRLVEAGSRSEEKLIAEAELRRAQAGVAYLKTTLELLTIRAPIAGHVLTTRIHEKVNERVTAGDEVCELGGSDHMLVEAFIDEADADVVEIGQPVRVKVRSYPLDVFEGRVELVSPAVAIVGDRRVLRIEATVDNARGLLRPRMTGYAEIDAGTRTILHRMLRRAVRWIRVRFLI